MAARGRASAALVDEFMADPFFAQPPPRSTGRERFGTAYAARFAERGTALGLSREDLLASAVDLIGASVADAVRRFVNPRGGVDCVYASGGGVHNAALMFALGRRLAPVRLGSAEDLDIPADGKEALAFAFLAHQTLCGCPGNVPAATGAVHAAGAGQHHARAAAMRLVARHRRPLVALALWIALAAVAGSCAKPPAPTPHPRRRAPRPTPMPRRRPRSCPSSPHRHRRRCRRPPCTSRGSPSDSPSTSAA
jgi:hypothetical protein